MQTGQQLQSLFVMILLHCKPVDHHCLWVDTQGHLCDDLQYQLIHHLHMPDLTEDQIYGYGLYLINVSLQKSGKSLKDFADMPVPQVHWENGVENQLIAEQYNYDLNALHQIVANGEGTLTNEQWAVYDAILTMVENNQAGGSFLHSAGGCGKTYVCNLLTAAVHAREKNCPLCDIFWNHIFTALRWSNCSFLVQNPYSHKWGQYLQYQKRCPVAWNTSSYISYYLGWSSYAASTSHRMN